MASTPPTPHEPEPRTGLSDAQRWTLGGLVALVVLLVVVIGVVAAGDDDEDVADTTTTTTTEAPTTTSEPTTTSAPEETTTTTFEPDVDPYEVAFPSPEASRSFEAPAAAARAYATDVLGFTELVIGAPSEGDGDRTEVVVQSREDGPETVVGLLRAGDRWYVTGSETADISVAEPAPGTSLASPFRTSGEALAFEGTVEVLVLSQTQDAPLGQGVVTGSGTPPAGPFQGEISFTPPTEATPGVLVYRVTSPEDGRVVAATSLPVRLTTLTS
ncbi:MAG: Gmad2 immunoglobulin-like domain-containing protein [Acidimicrobiia bacterium]